MDEKGELNTPAMNFDDTRPIKSGFTGSYLKNFKFKNVEICGINGSGINLSDCEDANITDFILNQDIKTKSELELSGCANTYIDNCIINGVKRDDIRQLITLYSGGAIELSVNEIDKII